MATLLLAAGATAGDHRLMLAGASTALGAWWVRPPRDPGRWIRGAAGEVATADLLARLPPRFVVLHDRCQPGVGGNLDHIVIGPRAIWVVDSKVRRARLRVRRGQVWAGDHPIDVAPVARQAARVEQALGVPVAALVVVHGTGLRGRGKVVDGVRIVPSHRLIGRLRRIKTGPRASRSAVIELAARTDRVFPRASRSG